MAGCTSQVRVPTGAVMLPPGPEPVSAERARRLSETGAGLSLKGGFDQLADDFAVDRVAGHASHDRFHDLAHVLEG